MGPPNFGSISQWVILDSSSRCSPLTALLCTHALAVWVATILPCTSFADGLSPGATVAKNTSRLSSYTSRLSSYPGRLHRCRKQSSYLAIWIIWSPSKFQEAVIWSPSKFHSSNYPGRLYTYRRQSSYLEIWIIWFA